MRINRILYVSLLLMAFVFVYFYGGKVPYMLFYTVLALPIVSFLHVLIGYFGLKCEQSLDNRSVVKGEKITYTLCVINRGVFFLPYVSIRFLGGVGMTLQQPDIRNIAIQPFSKRELCYEYVYKYRGCFELGVSIVEIQDFLGIFKLVRRNKQPLCVTVYPRIITIDYIGLSTQYLPDQMSKRSGIYEDVSALEEINRYHYGDSLKKVHWKLTAKMNEMMVKKYQSAAGTSVVLIVDLKKNTVAAEHSAAIEDKHIEADVAVLKCCLDKGATVRLVYQDEQMCTIECNSPLDFETAYQALTKVKFEQQASFKDIIDSQMAYGINKPDLLLSTSNVDYEFYETLCRVKSAGYEISLIYICAEEMTREKTSEVEQILSEISGLGIKVYRIKLSDDIKDVFEYGGTQSR